MTTPLLTPHRAKFFNHELTLKRAADDAAKLATALMDAQDRPDEQIVGVRLAALAEVLQRHLQTVAIDLTSSDDDQLIFETLNDRGTPLLAAGLINDYVFQQCDDLGTDIDTWGEQYWADFDNDCWRDEIAQGRLLRSKIDLFLQCWLTMRFKEELGNSTERCARAQVPGPWMPAVAKS